MSKYELWEAVGQHSSLAGQFVSPFQLDDDYIDRSAFRLTRLGLAVHEPFVAVHLRELPGGVSDHRCAPLETYFPAIKALTESGMKVVRFGLKNMTPLPEIAGLIDLVREVPGDQSLDFYAMARANFLLTTTSGPSQVASWLGTPQVITNVSSIGKNTLTNPAYTTYLPQKFQNGFGRVLTLSETLEHPVAYWEGYQSPGVEALLHIKNSPEEILRSVIEALWATTSPSLTSSNEDKKVNLIRDDYRAISKGRISTSFLELNQEWLR